MPTALPRIADQEYDFVAFGSQTSNTEVSGKSGPTNYAKQEVSWLSDTSPADSMVILDVGRVDKQIPNRSPSNLLKTIPGVVSSVGDQVVSVRCKLPETFVEVALPREIVPPNVARYGANVSIALDTSTGFRRLAVSPREVVPASDLELEELEQWARS